jgi:hypothetical protein
MMCHVHLLGLEAQRQQLLPWQLLQQSRPMSSMAHHWLRASSLE